MRGKRGIFTSHLGLKIKLSWAQFISKLWFILFFIQRADTSAVTYVPSPMSSPVKEVERRKSGRQSSIHSVRRSSRISLLPGMKERLSPIQTTEGEDLIHFWIVKIIFNTVYLRNLSLWFYKDLWLFLFLRVRLLLLLM